MNRQQIFDTVRDHLLAQGEQSTDGLRGCLYRGPDGLKCAVGVLIPDEMYDKDMEEKDVAWLVGDFGDELPEFFSVGENIELMDDLQSIHDTIAPELWAEELKFCATRQGLTP